MESYQFIFWEAIKGLALIVSALLAVKAIGSWSAGRRGAKPILYGAVLVLCSLGAWFIGHDLVAEVSYWRVEKYLGQHDYEKAYLSALRAVDTRPGNLSYWQELGRAKFVSQQFASLLEDEPTFRRLARAPLDEDDLVRFGFSHLFLDQYQQVLPITQELIRQNPVYAEPYVLQGMAEAALKKYPEAEQSFLSALRIYPSQPDAVEGLAQVYFLAGDTGRAVAALDATAKYPFSPESRRRFEALKAMYEQQ
jgi:tetratricopeptide (TPR) repeat protein